MTGGAPRVYLPGALQQRFRVERVLGVGAFGQVLLAEDRNLGREVALKLLIRSELEVLQRFRREARVTANLRHPHIAKVYDYGVADKYPFIVYEYLLGRSLRSYQEEGGVDPEQVRTWGAELAGALEVVHQAGILHRDVKPDNVMVREDGAAVLVDFGLATASDPGECLTRTGTVLGTLRFLSPEALAEARIDAGGDQYSLAATLSTVLTGRYYDRACLRLLGQPDVDPFPEHPLPWMAHLSRALSWEPEARFPDLASFREALLGGAPDCPPDWEELAWLRCPAPLRDLSASWARPGQGAVSLSGLGGTPAGSAPPTGARPGPSRGGGPQDGSRPSSLPGGSGHPGEGRSGARERRLPGGRVLLLAWGGIVLLLLGLLLGNWGGRGPAEEETPADPGIAAAAPPLPGRELLGELREQARRLHSGELPDSVLHLTAERTQLEEVLKRYRDPRVPLWYRRVLGKLGELIRAGLPGIDPAPLGLLEEEAVTRLAMVSVEIQGLERMLDTVLEWGGGRGPIDDRAERSSQALRLARDFREETRGFLAELFAGGEGQDLRVVLVAVLLGHRFTVPGHGAWMDLLLRHRREGPVQEAAIEAQLLSLEILLLSGDSNEAAFPWEVRRRWLEYLHRSPTVHQRISRDPYHFFRLGQRSLEKAPEGEEGPVLDLVGQMVEGLERLESSWLPSGDNRVRLRELGEVLARLAGRLGTGGEAPRTRSLARRIQTYLETADSDPVR